MHEPDTSEPAPIRMRVRSLGIDRVTRTVGVVLTEDLGPGARLLFLPLGRTGASRIAGARRARSVEPGLVLLLVVVASLGARIEHVALTMGPPTGAHGYPTPATTELVLSGGVPVGCDAMTGLALSVHAGVRVVVSGPLPDDALAPVDQVRTRYTAPTADPVEESVTELKDLLERACPADFDLRA